MVGRFSFYTLVETAKSNGIEPYAYLVHVIKHTAGNDRFQEHFFFRFIERNQVGVFLNGNDMNLLPGV